MNVHPKIKKKGLALFRISGACRGECSFRCQDVKKRKVLVEMKMSTNRLDGFGSWQHSGHSFSTKNKHFCVQSNGTYHTGGKSPHRPSRHSTFGQLDLTSMLSFAQISCRTRRQQIKQKRNVKTGKQESNLGSYTILYPTQITAASRLQLSPPWCYHCIRWLRPRKKR